MEQGLQTKACRPIQVLLACGHSHLSKDCQWAAIRVLQQQNEVLQRLCLAQLTLFTLWPFVGKISLPILVYV